MSEDWTWRRIKGHDRSHLTARDEHGRLYSLCGLVRTKGQRAPVINREVGEFDETLKCWLCWKGKRPAWQGDLFDQP